MNSAASCACSFLSMWSVAKLGRSGTLMHTSGVGMAASQPPTKSWALLMAACSSSAASLSSAGGAGLAVWFWLAVRRAVGGFLLLFRRVFLRRADALDDQEAEAVVGQPFQQRADADEERRAQAQVADGLARVVAAAGDEPAEEVDAA